MVTNGRFDGRHGGPDGSRDGKSPNGLRVLIVDDDTDTSDTMAILLSHWGFEAISVGSGLEALQAVQVHDPDLVLLDIGMPGLDGLQVARRLRAEIPPKGKAPFLIAVSGYGDVQTCQRSREAGIDLHLVKPVDPTELEKLLRRFEKVIMPAAERRTPKSYRPLWLDSSLRYWSDRAMLKDGVVKAAQILSRGNELRTRLRKTRNAQERIQIRNTWCAQASWFLNEAETVKGLLRTFHQWGTQIPSNA